MTPALLAGGPRVDLNPRPLDGPQGPVAALAAVPARRHRRGGRHPLATTLAVAVLGLMGGRPGYRAIGPWAQRLTPPPTPALGLLSLPDPPAVAAYLARVLPSTGPLALDGKTRRPSASATAAQRPLVGVVRHRLWHWVAQADGGDKDNEIPGAQRVLATLPLEDTLVTAEALPTQTTTAQLIGDRGGEYLLTVNANPPRLHPWLAHSRPGDVSPSADGDRAGPRPDRHPHDSGGAGLARDRVPVRPAGSPAHAGDGAAPRPIDPHTHRRTVTEVPTRETVSLLTRRYPEEARPADLLALARPHGSIEAMHHIEEVSVHADASTIRTGHGLANITTLTRLAWPSSGTVTRV